MDILAYIIAAFSGVAALTGIIGVVFLWKQTENLRLPSYRSLDSDERDLLKAMQETGTYIVTSFNPGELMPFILHKAKIDDYGLVHPAGLMVSQHYYEPCLRLRDRGIVRKPESNINTNVEYELTPKGVRFLSKRGKKLDKHSNHGKFRDQVEIEKQRRMKPNTIYGTAHDCIGCEPLGNTSGESWLAMITEYPLVDRKSDKICDVKLPSHVNHVMVGDYVYLRFNQAPLFLDYHDWFQVIVTQIKEVDGTHKVFVCGEDIAWAADTTAATPDQYEN